MYKVRKPNISVCYTPSSEPYSIYFFFEIHVSSNLIWGWNRNGVGGDMWFYFSCSEWRYILVLHSTAFIPFDKRIGKTKHLIFFKPTARAKELHAFPYSRISDDNQYKIGLEKCSIQSILSSHILQKELQTTRCHPRSSNFLLRKKKYS
jgi:hypothetical protein